MKIQKHWLKRLLALALVIVSLVQLLPAQALAATIENSKSSTSFIPGDVNGDGVVDAKDVNLTRRYIAGGYNVTINTYAADVNADGEIDAKDVNLTRRYIAGGYDVELQPALFTVSFYDGDRLIDTLTAVKGQPLGEVPSTQKSSKANAFLAGYFTDPECTQPFYAENPVTSDMKVYAKYEDMGTGETLNFTSFAQMDQQADISFEIIGDGDPNQAVTLEVMDGSDPVELTFTETADGYKFYAPEGFNEGCSYQLHLADGWTFTGKADTIRTASFSIYKEQVENLRMNDDIVYVKDTDAIDYLVGGQSYDMLTSELITEQGGSFNFSDAAIDVGDIICIYTGTHPEQRGMNADTLDPAYYVVAKAISGSTVTFTALGENDFLKLYNIPDNFPIKVDALPTVTTGTVNISALDADMYALMMGDGYTLATAKDAIEVGDFISMFISQDSIETEDDLYFGEITAYNAATGEITYKKVTRQDILDSMDLYRDIEISGNDLVTDEKKAEIEAELLQQISESGFAEDAAFILADLVTKTDGFKNAGIESLLITDSQGNELTSEEIQLLNLGTSFELTDDVELKVELITEGDQLHYKNGTQLAVGVEAEFEVELEDDEKIAIELNATFVQEVEIDPRIKGYIVPYVVFFIPIPVGANVNGTIDIKSFTAFSFEAEIFTVAPEDKEVWEQFKDIIEDPRKLAELPGMPEELSKGLNTVGDVFDKIEEIEDNMAKIKEKAEEFEETAEQYMGYAEDLEAIWNYVEANGLTTKEDWKGMCDTLDKTSITSDLLEMMDLTNETELETEYYESMEALMERYCEMVEKETDWVTLINKDLWSSPEICIYGISMSIDIDFVVRADLSLAIGSNMQYEVGKRYEFYFKFAPFYKNAGCNSMDLLDERFAFQFYVMGRLGLKAGVNAKFEVGIGSTTLANIGVSLELGPYMKFWGFFVYEYEKYRPANTKDWHSDERMAGSVLLEFGLYLKMAFEAEALDGAFSYEYEFLDEEFPLLTIGEEKFYYQPNYEPAEDESVRVKDTDGNSANGITMTLPDYMLALDYVDMREGYMAIEYLDYSKFNYTVSNPNFSIDRNTGLISVNVPDDTRYMECDLTITYKYGKLAFSTYDMTVTVPLVWTNLSTAELNEYFTAAVRVGNDADGYTTVWSQRVLKNQEYDLPTADEIKERIGWNEYKYDMGIGYGSQQTEDLTLIEDEVYDFNIGYDTYSVRVANVETDSGMTETRTYFARFGEEFDFSDLASTGTNANGAFTKFAELTHSIVGLDLANAIDSDMAAILANGVTAYAKYIDNSVTATFKFSGMDAEDVTLLLRRGDEPTLAQIQRIAEDAGLAIKEITPAITPITTSTLYQVICGELDTEPATVTFVENGGSEVDDITKPYGSIIGNLPVPEKAGSTFAGWYADEDLTVPFTLTKMPQGGATAYAKWNTVEYIVTFHVNGGNELEDDEMTVTYGQAYGKLPAPTKNGYGFAGWFTAAEGGKQITAESIYDLTEDQTLYAQWRELVEIPKTVFAFGDMEIYVYEKDTEREVEYIFVPDEGASYTANDFVFKFMRQGDSEYVDAPINAGTYNVTVSRPADNVYAKFEETYEAVVYINKATRDAGAVSLTQVGAGLTYVELELTDGDGGIYDLSENAVVTFHVVDADGNTRSSAPGSNVVRRLKRGDVQYAYVTVEDPNYRKWSSEHNTTDTIALKSAPYIPIEGYGDFSWYNETDTVFTITTAEQMLALAYQINSGADSFGGKTIKLGNDIDLSDYQWSPMGTKSNPFCGTFDGQGYTISGLYVDTNGSYAGLFGYTYYYLTLVLEDGKPVYNLGVPVMEVTNATIQNLILDDAYVKGTVDAGGIVGAAHYTEIINCISYAEVQTTSTDEDVSSAGAITGTIQHSDIINCIGYGNVTGMYGAGGISGTLGSSSVIINCINYGEVHGIYSDSYGTGGIVGISNDGVVENCVNLGNVSGISSVGGVVGLNETEYADVLNCYSAGQVYGAKSGKYMYVGAVVGRNQSNDGYVANCYYLKNSAKNGEGDYCLGGGTSKGSEDYVKNHFYTGSFTSLTSQIEGEKYTGGILIDVLNAYVNDALDEGVGTIKQWVEDVNGYPVPNLRLPVIH